VSLREILKNKAVEIHFSKSTVYCFDSEAFRFLAGVKSQSMTYSAEEKENFCASYRQSRKETVRLLQEIKNLEPYQVSSTISLNTVRDTVQKLTGPFTKIAANLKTNTRMLEEHQKELLAIGRNITELLGKKMLKIRTLKVVRIDHPKTVCTNLKCKRILKINEHESKTNYVTECHAPCGLKGIQHDIIGHERLLKCDCITPTGDKQTCTKCGHSYKEHMHIVYDFEEVDAEVEDTNILQMIDQKNSEKDKREQLLKITEKKIAEMRSEERIIKEAFVKSACFLKLSSIASYNDAMVDLMNHLIREEKDIVNEDPGRGKARLRSLEGDLKAYQTEVAILMENLNMEGETSAASELPDIEHLFTDLYNLKNYGRFIRDALESLNKSQSSATPTKYVKIKKELQSLLGFL
jgi:hypothetical protein